MAVARPEIRWVSQEMLLKELAPKRIFFLDAAQSEAFFMKALDSDLGPNTWPIPNNHLPLFSPMQ